MTSPLRALLRRVRGESRPLPRRFDPEALRVRQRQVAREAFLSQQPGDRRVLLARDYGDTH